MVLFLNYYPGFYTLLLTANPKVSIFQKVVFVPSILLARGLTLALQEMFANPSPEKLKKYGQKRKLVRTMTYF